MQASKYRNTGRHIEVQLGKIGIGETWPRLMESPKKPAWLKIDFDHFAFDDEDSTPEMDVNGDYEMTVSH
jgi:very-long-chain (3R)-3-hydroxyacyl-CoA dehydratase